MPRQLWKKARIDELIPGRDGLIRTVKLRLPDKTKISRPVQLVIPLEVDQGGEDVEDRSIFPFNFLNELSVIMFSFFVSSVYSLYYCFL